MTDHNIEHQLAALAEIIRDDVARAERVGRHSIGLNEANYYIERLEALLALSKSGGGQ